jgi:hypothetical protein
MATKEITVTAAGYVATLDVSTSRVSISHEDGIWSGDGRWDGARIVDCAANLGDEVYDALDEALLDACDD